ncbi:hypothetical protein [Staphylococcus phage vB_SauH_DELF3]|nr:hypothetical protein [Staphylococcus phage vB_SauH_DELF3]
MDLIGQKEVTSTVEITQKCNSHDAWVSVIVIKWGVNVLTTEIEEVVPMPNTTNFKNSMNYKDLRKEARVIRVKRNKLSIHETHIPPY